MRGRWAERAEGVLLLAPISPDSFLLSRPLGWITDLQGKLRRERREVHLHERSALVTTECFPPGPCSGSVLLILTSWAVAVKEILRPQLPLPFSNTHPAFVRPCREITVGQYLKQERVKHYLEHFSLAEGLVNYSSYDKYTLFKYSWD